MEGLIIEGDTGIISDIQLQYIKDVLKILGYNNNKVLVEAIGKAGENYVADVKRFTVQEDDGTTFKIVVKAAPTSEMVRQNMQTQIMFRNEHIMYTQLLPKLVELQEQNGLPKENFFRYPKCYASSLSAPNEVIILEDLKELKYKTLNRKEPLSNDNIKMVLKEMAVLHSLSYALKKTDREAFDKFSKDLVNIWLLMANVEAAKTMFIGMEKDILSVITEERYSRVIKGTLSEIVMLTKELNEYDLESKQAVIQQGDAWTNNIMFKYDEDKLISCIMIDYQISKLSNPVADLFYLIFNCTDYEMRSKNFKNWIDYYHNELDKALTKLELKVDEVYPRAQVDIDMKRHSKHTLATCLLLQTIFLRDTSDCVDFKSQEVKIEKYDELKGSKLTDLPEHTINDYKTRIYGIVETLVDFDLM